MHPFMTPAIAEERRARLHKQAEVARLAASARKNKYSGEVGERVKLLAVPGSLKRESANAALVRAAASAASDANVEVWDELDGLPHFSPDRAPNEHVESLRAAVAASDAVLVATPEYAGGMPGALKNALDWLVGSGELYGKPVVVVSAAPDARRGHNARRWVEEVARMQGATVRDSFTVAITSGDDDAEIASKALETLQRSVAAIGD
jgi:NAD(P)H-dependent FMN reductase